MNDEDWEAGQTLTEPQWAVSSNSVAMELHLRFQLRAMTDRKRRLFECECCRSVWDRLPDPRSRLAVEVAERFADGQAAEIDCEAASVYAQEVWDEERPSASAPEDVDDWGRWFFPRPFSAAAYNVLLPFGYWGGAPAFDSPSRIIREAAPDESAERTTQAALLRDIFGNPFRPMVFDSNWRSETAVAMATGVYTERAFDRLPILADALEEAGCDHSDLLAHCRGPGPHVRGCWVVDGVLGKG